METDQQTANDLFRTTIDANISATNTNESALKMQGFLREMMERQTIALENIAEILRRNNG